VVISIRIPRKLKKELEELNINVSEVVRELLEKYVRKKREKILLEELKKLREHLAGKIDPKTIAKLVREDRERL